MNNNNQNLPKGWRRVKLGKMLKPLNFKLIKIKVSEYKKNGKVPIFDQGSTEVAGYTDNINAQYIGRLPVVIFGDHTLLLKLVKFPFAIGADGIQILNPDDRILDITFFYYLCKFVISKKLKSYGYERHLKYLKELDIIIPEDINEQRRIAEILSSFDEKIELNNKINKTLEKMAQEIFDEWFVKNKKLMVKREKLENLVNITYGYGPSSSQLKKTGYPVYGANGIIGYFDSYQFSDRQIIVGCRGVVGNVILTLPQCTVTHNALIITPRNGRKVFFYYLLRNQNLNAVVGGSAQPQITIKELSQFNLLIPNEELQDKFELIAKTIEQKRLMLFYENQKLTAFRDLLLPKLMSGEIQV